MVRAYVPEAAVHEDRQPLAREGDVDGSSPVAGDLEDDAEPATTSMEFATKRNLGGRVTTTRLGHPLRDWSRGCAGMSGHDGPSSFDQASPRSRRRWLPHFSTPYGCDEGATRTG